MLCKKNLRVWSRYNIILHHRFWIVSESQSTYSRNTQLNKSGWTVDMSGIKRSHTTSILIVQDVCTTDFLMFKMQVRRVSSGSSHIFDSRMHVNTRDKTNPISNTELFSSRRLARRVFAVWTSVACVHPVNSSMRLKRVNSFENAKLLDRKLRASQACWTEWPQKQKKSLTLSRAVSCGKKPNISLTISFTRWGALLDSYTYMIHIYIYVYVYNMPSTMSGMIIQCLWCWGNYSVYTSPVQTRNINSDLCISLFVAVQNLKYWVGF